ncbi:Chlorophyllase-1, chloroplastic [Tetrabaena socialis]|uniref:Chlorophyllase-1, chloroplastic n=1 Tax=Tetrabaena socialis TaxID=47790 RepID=A0A2J8AGI1_9CHLO|nr:Chlorophyllase-1, chloroplastic [Tetrabaena socialis]|eukprot:PNH11638.1 Chlorophyllase-1, chloroplastic [Tetrabaena socialis]
MALTLPRSASALALVLNMAAAVISRTAVAQSDYTSAGPFTVASMTQRVVLLYFFNGFQARAPWYGGIVRHAASWGYVVVQYTVPGLLPIVVDRLELGYLPPLMSWVAAQGARSGGPLFGLPDTTRTATAGHSRGGKLAALHYAGRADIATAVLFDPVDGSGRAPEGPDYPSAAKALAAANKTAALIGAGITGSCNPEGSNYPKFFAALAPGSWQMVVLQAGHMQFCRTGNAFADWSLDRLCRRGNLSSQTVIDDAAALAVAWLESTFRPKQAQPGLRQFREWVDGQVAASVVSFTVAGGAGGGGGGQAQT